MLLILGELKKKKRLGFDLVRKSIFPFNSSIQESSTKTGQLPV